MSLWIFLSGTTASGKSQLALSIAEKYNAIIINADSQQLYKELPLLTMTPTLTQQEQIPHYLYGLSSYKKKWTVCQWLEEVKKIHQSLDEKKVRLLVGGTGLYLHALQFGFSPVPGMTAEWSQAFWHHEENKKKFGYPLENDKLWHYLHTIDPESAQTIHPHNQRRLMRAIEVFCATNKTFASYKKQPRESLLQDEKIIHVSLRIPTESLNQRIEQRLQFHFQRILHEIQNFFQDNPDYWNLPSLTFKPLGISFFCQDNHDVTRWTQKQTQEFYNYLLQQTKHYAKRQRTWFRHTAGINHFLDYDAKKSQEQNYQEMESTITCVMDKIIKKY
jgi:tRNA dimethylallyltransferase